jgi:hypothetical protein
MGVMGKGWEKRDLEEKREGRGGWKTSGGESGGRKYMGGEKGWKGKRKKGKIWFGNEVLFGVLGGFM